MKLKREDTDLFYRLNWSLLFYVNQKYSVIKDLKEPFLKDENPRKIVELNEIYRETYWEEIDELLAKKPSLENVYHREIGKSNTRKISKRLSEIGVAPAWFAVYEDVVIASGKSEKVVRAQIADMLPEEKNEGAYVFRYGKSIKK